MALFYYSGGFHRAGLGRFCGFYAIDAVPEPDIPTRRPEDDKSERGGRRGGPMGCKWDFGAFANVRTVILKKTSFSLQPQRSSEIPFVEFNRKRTLHCTPS